MTNIHDYTYGDHSFKNWFSIMWANFYIQSFSMFFILLVLQIVFHEWVTELLVDNWNDDIAGGLFAILGMLIPISGCLIVGYKGFYQLWNDLKAGRRR